MNKTFRVVVGIALIALAAAAWFFGSADFVRFSDTNGIAFVHCDEPADMREPECARKFCETALMKTHAVPPGHTVISTGVLEDATERETRVNGYIKSANADSDRTKLFSCFVTDGKVKKIEVSDGSM